MIKTTDTLSTIIKKHCQDKLSVMTSSEKINYWDRLNNSYRAVNMVYVKKKTHGDVIYDNLLFSKGYLLKNQRLASLKKSVLLLCLWIVINIH